MLTGDIKNTGNLEREYKIAKLDFDSAQSTASGLASTPGPKHDNAQVKLQSASDNYETVKRRVRDAIERIENNKNNDVNQKWTQVYTFNFLFFLSFCVALERSNEFS